MLEYIEHFCNYKEGTSLHIHTTLGSTIWSTLVAHRCRNSQCLHKRGIHPLLILT